MSDIRYTRKNPNGSYRIPFNVVGEFRMQNNQYSGAYYGDFVDKLGKIEELNLDMNLLERLARVPEKKLQEFLKTV